MWNNHHHFTILHHHHHHHHHSSLTITDSWFWIINRKSEGKTNTSTLERRFSLCSATGPAHLRSKNLVEMENRRSCSAHSVLLTLGTGDANGRTPNIANKWGMMDVTSLTYFNHQTSWAVGICRKAGSWHNPIISNIQIYPDNGVFFLNRTQRANIWIWNGPNQDTECTFSLEMDTPTWELIAFSCIPGFDSCSLAQIDSTLDSKYEIPSKCIHDFPISSSEWNSHGPHMEPVTLFSISDCRLILCSSWKATCTAKSMRPAISRYCAFGSR